MARMGAKVTGIDLSDKAIETAVNMADQMNVDARFICCDIYDLPKHISQKFDVVFSTYGTIAWLPDLDKWANIISGHLKPGSKFIFVEFHPVVWMFDDDFKSITYNYFKESPIIETINGTYADRSAPIHTETISWNHSISEVITALLNNGLQLTTFEEFNYSPYDCFNNTVEGEPCRYRIKQFGNKIPMLFSLTALKVANG